MSLLYCICAHAVFIALFEAVRRILGLGFVKFWVRREWAIFALYTAGGGLVSQLVHAEGTAADFVLRLAVFSLLYFVIILAFGKVKFLLSFLPENIKGKKWLK